MKKKNILIFSLILIIAVITIVFNYLNKDHRNISAEKADVNTTSAKFFSTFNTNQEEFNRENLEKVIELKGIISSSEGNSIILDEKILVTFKDTNTVQLNNKEVTIKGRYVGYDDLLEQLKIDQATLIK